MAWLSSLLGGGVQPEGQKNTGNSDVLNKIIDKATEGYSNNMAGKKATEASISSNMDLSQNYNKYSEKAPLKGKPMDSGFYGHMTIPSARKDSNITGAGDVFSKTKEDRVFKRSSNLSGKKRG